MASEPQNEAGGRPTDAGSSGDDRIKERAYLIWVDEGRPDGRDLDHWLRARWELEREPQSVG